MLGKLFYRGPSIEDLHRTVAKSGALDTGAPVSAAVEVLVHAPVERVWAVLSDPAGWPALEPSISEVTLPSGVAEDAPFRWRNGGMRISSRFAVVDAPRELTWTGETTGIKAVHRQVLRAQGEDETVLRSEESMAGPLLTLFYSDAKLEQGLRTFVAAIKRGAESA